MTSPILRSLRARGFDQAYSVAKGLYRPACSQCEALVINGCACHETGCPNEQHECSWCNALIPRGQKYCEACE